MIAITNGRFFYEDLLLIDKTIFIEDGKISRITDEEIPAG
jgi:N-acetylglucosamine-6-phosphate deacetylase